jgi:hypothetical protein
VAGVRLLRGWCEGTEAGLRPRARLHEGRHVGGRIQGVVVGDLVHAGAGAGGLGLAGAGVDVVTLHEVAGIEVLVGAVKGQSSPFCQWLSVE